jgi:hypothetical protein
MKNIKKYIKLFVIPFCAMTMFMISCDEINIKEKESSALTYIKNIRILNGGLNGDSVVNGKVNEDTKLISFPKLHKDTDLSKVKFAADLPAGAKFDKETYDFTIDTVGGSTQTTVRITVLNEKRYRAYDVTIRLSVPVFGADFSRAKILYDGSGNKNAANIYPGITDATTRSGDMDSAHVLIVSRDATGPHLLKIADLRQNNVVKIPLNQTGVATSGVTFAISAGCLAQGHIYAVSLSNVGAATPLNIYHWDSPTAVPTKIFSENTGDYGATNRVGDDMSMHLDASGNGYIFLGNNAATIAASNKVLRIKVTNFTTLTDPTFLTMPVSGGYWSTYSLVDESTDEYIYTGNAGGTGGMALVGLAGNGIYTTPATSPLNRAGDAQIINYNKERYLAMITGAGGTPSEVVLYVYNITKGETNKDALQLINPDPAKATYSFKLGGGISGTHPAYLSYVKTDDALFLFGIAPGAGFVVIEVPFATEYDSFYDE